jgi:hypothetical protein
VDTRARQIERYHSATGPPDLGDPTGAATRLAILLTDGWALSWVQTLITVLRQARQERSPPRHMSSIGLQGKGPSGVQDEE